MASQFGLITPIRLDPLTVDVPSHCGGWLSARPFDCSIDARQPFAPDGSSIAGTSHLDLDFAFDSGVYEASAFSVREIPDNNSPPEVVDTIRNPEGLGPSWLRLQFDRSVSPGAWTCVTLVVTGQETCFAYLPGDVNRDGTSDLRDADRLMDCIAGSVPYTPRQCDIDRSGACTPADLLRLADVFNGAEAFPVWLGATIPGCPSAP